ncbi:MAG: polysaccharide pyruvyl transferase family protein [Synergistaceae bacterium]|jgi:polysaccharide pyruvyl transferase CsaB|nr:polysaccharide pyruvyl transferase family protein [Synergistaceae bacterium]
MKSRFSDAVYDVLLAGYFGFANLGDELLAYSAVKNLSELGVSPDKIAILSGNPKLSERNLGIRAFDRWSVPSVSKALNMSRSLLLAGGGLFQDASSARSCMYYWGLVRMAVWKSRPVWALGQSVGPLYGGLAKYLARDALSRCVYLAVRDEASLDALKSMNISPEVMPDLVFALPVLEIPPCDSGAVLVNIRPQNGAADCEQAVIKVARMCGSSGMELLYAAMSPDDELEIKKFQESGDLPKGEIITVATMDDFASAAKRARVAVGMRLHFGILSVLMGLRLVMSAYDPKVACFARDWGVRLLSLDDLYSNFDVKQLLTNSHFQDKRKRDSVSLLVTSHFDIGLRRVLGE